jgi:tRNA G18 (ribose-2'-O)-methylase SpoU
MRKLKLAELNRPTLQEYEQAPKLPIVVIADNIRSGLNIGSLFRTSDAFAIEEIILTGISARPPHKEINKTAIGATDSVNWRYEEDIITAIEQLKKLGYSIYGIEQTTNSKDLANISLSKDQKVAIILGNEVDGISESLLPLLDMALEIPQYGTKHSLNVSVCAGIVLHHLSCFYR